MCGRFYLDTIHVNHANLVMRYLSIRESDLIIGNTAVTLESQDYFYDMQ